MSLNQLLSPGAAGAVGQASPEIREWLKELDASMKRERDWRKDAQTLVELYECGKQKEYQFNILYSNTETMAPALYNSVPRPIVKRRFNDADPIGKVCSQVVQRSLEFLLDNEILDYTPFDDLMSQSVLEALVPGRGVTWFKYDATITEAQNDAEADAVEGTSIDEDGSEEDQEAKELALPSVNYETVCGEVVPWNRFLHGYAKQWKDVPWVAREHFMTREELEKNFGAAGLTVPLTISGTEAESMVNDERDDRQVTEGDGAKLGHVFEIWDKDEKRVLFLAPARPESFLREVEDPLKLSGFFPCPRPLTFFPKIKSLVPVPLYKAYEEQAKELNRVTVRINKIIAALKVRGFYDSTLEGLDRVLQADDNVLIPAENVAAMQQGQTLERAIWLMPLEKLIGVLQQLYIQRQQTKQVIYELTGIADIMRGASAASETLGAQQLKSQWGSLRLKRSQKMVQNYARECLRIMAEIVCTKLSPETISGMTGLQYPTADQKAQAQQAIQMLQASGQQPGPEGQKLMAIASQPSWDEIMQVLSNDLTRNYHIDIETNSTVDAEATEDKQAIGEFLNAVAQFMNGIGPLVQQGIMPFDAAKAMLLGVVRRYRFGDEVEQQLQAMQPPKPPEDTGAKEKQQQAQLEIQKMQMEMQARQQELQQEMALKQQEHQMKLVEMQRKAQLGELQFNQKLRTMQMQAQQAAQQAAMKAAEKPAGVTTE